MGSTVPSASFEAWIVALLFLVGLAAAGWAIVRYVRKSGGQGATGLPEGVRILARVPLGMNHAVVLLEMVDHVLVVGVGEQITLIDRIDDKKRVKDLLVASNPSIGPFALFRREHLASETGAGEFRKILDDAVSRIRARSVLLKVKKGDGDDA